MRRLRLRQDDAQRLQRSIGQVAEAQAAGTLPSIAWHDGLGEAERAELRMRWPVSTAFWDGLARRPGARQILSSEASRLLFPLRELLMACRAQPDAVLTVIANALASACFGSRHLWQDLGATGRDEVSRLLALAFPDLHASNTADLRWKRHLFLVLGERTGQAGLRPPKCETCDDYLKCHGDPATADVATGLRAPIR